MTDKEIIIKPKYDFKTVFNANLFLTFNRLATKILIFFAALTVISLLLIYFIVDKDYNSEAISSLLPMLFLIIFYPILLVLLTFYITNKSLKSNYRLEEDFKFIFNNEYFRELGETFDLKHKWDKLLKIKEREDYFLIYQSKNKANIIPKNSFSTNQLSDFKNLLKKIDIKTKFK